MTIARTTDKWQLAVVADAFALLHLTPNGPVCCRCPATSIAWTRARLNNFYEASVMTLVVVGIALLHAVPVLLIAAWTKSKFSLAVAAIVASAIGVVTGNPAYLFADLVGVGIAFGLGLSLINSRKAATAPSSSDLRR